MLVVPVWVEGLTFVMLAVASVKRFGVESTVGALADGGTAACCDERMVGEGVPTEDAVALCVPLAGLLPRVIMTALLRLWSWVLYLP